MGNVPGLEAHVSHAAHATHHVAHIAHAAAVVVTTANGRLVLGDISNYMSDFRTAEGSYLLASTPPELSASEKELAALGTCVAVGLQANAVARGWTVRAIELELEGDINVTSVWGTGDLSPKPLGLTAVRIKTHLDIDGATPAELDELVAHAAKFSPVLNTVRNPVPVEIARS